MDENMYQEVDNHRQLKAYITQETQALRNTISLYVLKSGLASGQSLASVADDILNEMVIEALNHAYRFDPSRPPKAWLLGIAANLIRRKQAKQIAQNQREPLIRDLYPQSQALMSDDDLFDQLSHVSHSDPESQLESDETIHHLLSLVSPADREVLQLAIVEGIEGESLARKLGISAGAARVRLHRAINRLRIARQAQDEEGDRS